MSRLTQRRKLGIALVALALLVGVVVRITVGSLYHLRTGEPVVVERNTFYTYSYQYIDLSPSSPWVWLALASLIAGVLCLCLRTDRKSKT